MSCFFSGSSDEAEGNPYKHAGVKMIFFIFTYNNSCERSPSPYLCLTKMIVKSNLSSVRRDLHQTSLPLYQRSYLCLSTPTFRLTSSNQQNGEIMLLGPKRVRIRVDGAVASRDFPVALVTQMVVFLHVCWSCSGIDP